MVFSTSECKQRVRETIEALDQEWSLEGYPDITHHGELSTLDSTSMPFSDMYEWKNDPMLPTSYKRVAYGIVDDREITPDSLNHVLNSFEQFYEEKDPRRRRRRMDYIDLITISVTDEVGSDLKEYVKNPAEASRNMTHHMLFVIETKSKTPYKEDYGKVMHTRSYKLQKEVVNSVLNPALND